MTTNLELVLRKATPPTFTVELRQPGSRSPQVPPTQVELPVAEWLASARSLTADPARAESSLLDRLAALPKRLLGLAPTPDLHAVAGERPDPTAWQAHGRDLHQRLSGALGRLLDSFAERGADVRLLLRCEDAPDLYELLWETWGGARSPVASGRWELVRRPVDREARLRQGDVFRVLLLVARQADLAGGRDAAFSAFRALRELSRGEQFQCDLAGPDEAYGLSDERFPVGPQPRDAVDRDFRLHSADEVLRLLREGRYDVVHLIGKSDAGDCDPEGAGAFLFDFPAFGLVRVEAFTDALRSHPPGLVVLQCCAGRPRAALLVLSAADHVVTMTGYPPPDLCGDWAGPFYEELARCRRIGPAMRAARRRLFGDPRWRDSGWMPAHWACTDDDLVCSPEHVALQTYRARVERELSELELGFGRDRTVVLAQAHVPLLLEESDPERERATPSGAHRIEEMLELEGERRWVVRGEPGAGKTTTLRAHALRLAGGEGRQGVPIYLSLPEWIRRRGSQASNKPAAVLNELEHEKGIDDLAAALEDSPRTLLLDGWDELGEEGRELAGSAIASLSKAWSSSPIVVAARVGSAVQLDGAWREARLVGMDEDQQTELLTAWLATRHPIEFAKARAADVVRAIASGGRAPVALGRNPMMLTILADLLLAGVDVVGRRRFQLLEEVVARLLRGEYIPGEKRDTRMPYRPTREWLAALAWTMTERCQRAAGRDELERWMEGHEHTAALEGKGSFEELLEHIAEHTGLLAPQGRDRARWEWAHHRLLQEALCASHWMGKVLGAAGRPEDVLAKIDEVLEGADDAPLEFWTEPTALVAEQIADGEELLVPLLRDPKRRELGLRVLGAVEGIGAATCGDVLRSTVLPAWEPPADERVRAYQLLVPAAADPAKAIETLAARAKGEELPRAELGALVECVDALGERGPNDEAEATIASILWRRLPRLTAAEVDAHFRWVPGRGPDDAEPLWCRAPSAGEEALGFLMGDGKVAVRIERPFWIAATTVTFDQYRIFAPELLHPRGGGRIPVTRVSWFEAALYCRWLEHERRRSDDASLTAAWSRALPSEVSGELRFALPTEAQWEFACRAGTPADQVYWSGDDEAALRRVAWFNENSELRVHGVAGLEPNPWGLYDVHGNVWEWCRDWWAPELRGGVDPAGSAGGAGRVQRGGGFRSVAAWCRSAARVWQRPGLDADFFVDVDCGFRVALSAPRAFGAR